MSLAMQPGHPRWAEFTGRLAAELQRRGGGEDRKPDFRLILKGCDSTTEKPAARKILEEMNAPVAVSLVFFEERGGHCDCEILLNVDS